jgi:hypothetical protein
VGLWSSRAKLQQTKDIAASVHIMLHEFLTGTGTPKHPRTRQDEKPPKETKKHPVSKAKRND